MLQSLRLWLFGLLLMATSLSFAQEKIGVVGRTGAGILEKAKEFGFESCYLETMPYMMAAQKLYKRNGFTSLDKPVGNTGHYACNVWMLKKI